MPELPEVETVRTGLDPLLAGRTFTDVIVSDFPGVLGDCSIDEAIARLTGRVIAGVDRRGKFLIVRFADGDGAIAHLRMTGVLTLEAGTAPLPRFHRLTLPLDDGNELRFADQRKFGRVQPATESDIAALDARLGPEPLTEAFSPSYLERVLKGRSAPIKSLLLDQHLIAGLGNIYVDEALFLARVHPATPGGALTPAQLDVLHQTCVEVLIAGIEHRGVSFSSFRDVYGAAGTNQQHLVVYGRGSQAQPCVRCGTPLQRIVISNRGTSFCPLCQALGQS